MFVPVYNKFGLLVLALGLFRGARGIPRKGNLWLTEETRLWSWFRQQRTALFLKSSPLVSTHWWQMPTLFVTTPFLMIPAFLPLIAKLLNQPSLLFLPSGHPFLESFLSLWSLNPSFFYRHSGLSCLLAFPLNLSCTLQSLNTPLLCLGHELLLEKSNHYTDWCHHTPVVFKLSWAFKWPHNSMSSC